MSVTYRSNNNVFKGFPSWTPLSYQRGGFSVSMLEKRWVYERGGNSKEAGVMFQSMKIRGGIDFNILNNNSNNVNVSIE